MRARIIRVSGVEEIVEIGRKSAAFSKLSSLLSADCFDHVNLRDGTIMIVDDTGAKDGKPINAKATNLYRSVCRLGTTHCICGDVAVVNDADFE